MHATVREPNGLGQALLGQWQGIVTGERRATERRGGDEGNDCEGREPQEQREAMTKESREVGSAH
jgi:hypothetical protein